MQRKIQRFRTIDVGRKGHHYLEVWVMSGKGPRGGTTKAHLVTKADLQKRVRKAIQAHRR